MIGFFVLPYGGFQYDENIFYHDSSVNANFIHEMSEMFHAAVYLLELVVLEDPCG